MCPFPGCSNDQPGVHISPIESANSQVYRPKNGLCTSQSQPTQSGLNFRTISSLFILPDSPGRSAPLFTSPRLAPTAAQDHRRRIIPWMPRPEPHCRINITCIGSERLINSPTTTQPAVLIPVRSDHTPRGFRSSPPLPPPSGQTMHFQNGLSAAGGYRDEGIVLSISRRTALHL